MGDNSRGESGGKEMLRCWQAACAEYVGDYMTMEAWSPIEFDIECFDDATDQVSNQLVGERKKFSGDCAQRSGTRESCRRRTMNMR